MHLLGAGGGIDLFVSGAFPQNRDCFDFEISYFSTNGSKTASLISMLPTIFSKVAVAQGKGF
ncbi:MAG: hypothetical protein FWH37_06400 [Candidatus Bathyarchaeota archaeon]|nr:hypothetical protein [Candidatus Termiticorpusculum sp.]